MLNKEGVPEKGYQIVRLHDGHEVTVPIDDTEMLKTIIKHDDHMLMRETMRVKDHMIPPSRTWAYVIFVGEVLAFLAFITWLAFG